MCCFESSMIKLVGSTISLFEKYKHFYQKFVILFVGDNFIGIWKINLNCLILHKYLVEKQNISIYIREYQKNINDWAIMIINFNYSKIDADKFD